MKRRTCLLGALSMGILGRNISTSLANEVADQERMRPSIRISLGQWSLHRALFGEETLAFSRTVPWPDFLNRVKNEPTAMLSGPLDPLDFPLVARQRFDINAVEYSNTFYFGVVNDQNKLAELKRRSDGEGVRNLLLLCDQEGALGDPDPKARARAVENHFKWAEMAALLECSAIRVNAVSEGEPEEQIKLIADGLHQLNQYTSRLGLDMLVENLRGISSDAEWLARLLRHVSNDEIGALIDFGNFAHAPNQPFDPYRGTEILAPFARGVSAKTLAFDDSGNEASLDYGKLLGILGAAGYSGYYGIEYEGDSLPEDEGIRKSKALLTSLSGSTFQP